MKYTGEKCFACNETFEKEDDVVVCPECGTPYHRHCYKEKGHCINSQLHESGIIWKRSVNENASQNNINNNQENSNETEKRFEESGNINNAEREPFNQSGDGFIRFELNKPLYGLDPNEDFEGVKMIEMFSFVKTNTLYYIPLFKKMKDMGSKISFNISSFLFPYFYFAHRKMWLMAIISVLVTLVLQIPSFLINLNNSIEYGLIDENMISYAEAVFHNLLIFIDSNYNMIENIAFVCSIGSYLFKIAMCLFSNWLYYRFAIKSINKIKSQNLEVPKRVSAISSAGGTSMANIFLILLVIVGCYFLISFAIDMFSILL